MELASEAKTPEPDKTKRRSVSEDSVPLHPLFAEAARRRATHVHLDPVGSGALITLRVAGQLVESDMLDAQQLDAISSLLSEECDVPAGQGYAQRGEITWRGNRIDFVGLPTDQGESWTFRLDSGEQRDRTLESLGMRRELVASLRPMLAGGGLVLVAGGAGEGRSTTLRALIGHFADKTRRAMLIEGEVGPALSGAAQIAVTRRCSMGEALRSASLHDAEIVAADSLEDRHDAAAAIQAAQAGLLVLAGVQVPHAVDAVRRMREWRVEPFPLASTLKLVLAQRLAQRLCPECREPIQAQGSIAALLGFERGSIVYGPGGCPACGQSGYVGKIAAFEAIHADAAIRRLINDGGDDAILARHAYIAAPNLTAAARAMAREGSIAPDEAVRISRMSVGNDLALPREPR